MSKISGIYSITNILNKYKYIGSSDNIEIRWRNHLNLLKNGKHPNAHLQNSYNLYGLDNFLFEIIEKCEIVDLIEKENCWIKNLNCIEPYGFNIAKDALAPMKGRKHTEETKIKMSNKVKGKSFTEDHKKKISESRKGIIFSENTKKKMSESRIGISLSIETKQKMSEAKKR